MYILAHNINAVLLITLLKFWASLILRFIITKQSILNNSRIHLLKYLSELVLSVPSIFPTDVYISNVYCQTPWG